MALLSQTAPRLSVFIPADKIPPQEIFQIRPGPCPVPDPVVADPDVDVRVEVKTGQPFLPVEIRAVPHLTVPEMADCPGNMADALGHRLMNGMAHFR